MGPNVCSLYFVNAESVNHFMVGCPFTMLVWKEIRQILKIDKEWEGDSLIVFFDRWLRGAEGWKELPCFVLWEIWKQRNKVIFEIANTLVWRVVHQSILYFKEYH